MDRMHQFLLDICQKAYDLLNSFECRPMPSFQARFSTEIKNRPRHRASDVCAGPPPLEKGVKERLSSVVEASSGISLSPKENVDEGPHGGV